MSKVIQAGIVTAYGAAVRGGYTGTYDKFCSDLAELADVLSEFLGFRVTIETLNEGTQATASYNDGVLALCIPRGNTGNGIQRIEHISTQSLVKTYRITYTSGTYFDFQVSDGNGIDHTTLNADYTLTITYTDGTTWTSGSIRGATGATPNLTIGTVETLLPTQSATATITGTAEDPVLNLGIPKGDTGEVSQAEFDDLSGTVSNLNRQISDIESALDETRKNSENLAYGHTLREKTLWNCWAETVYAQANDNYYCLEFDLPANAEYISSNYTWADNSFSAFVDDNYNKIALIKDSVTTGNVYAVPSGATKACISFAVNHYNTKYNSIGVVYVVGQTNITNKTVDDYPQQTFYYADNLLLKIENDKTVGAVVSGLVDVSKQFIEKKNLFAEITTGKYSIAWNVGDTVTFGDGANYAYGIADVEGLTNVTINMISMSDAFSFFTDAQNKKVATSADNRVGTSRVYNVPSGAKYFYVSSSDITTWTQYGFVMLEGTDDIATNPASISQYPYNTTVFFADDLMLSSGLTVGEALETASKVYHVEKDGSGDYDSLVAAIQEAVKHNNSVVYVGAGTWDIVDEFGSTYMESVTSSPSTWGLELKNGVHIIGTSKTLITANYEGTNENTRQYFSAFNAGAHGFTLENVRVIADNIRYVIHDDRGSGGQTPYTNRYINCDFKLTHGYYDDTALGGGLGVNGTFEILNCRFEGSAGTHRLAYYHGNNYSGETGAKCTIIVQGCYFAGDGSFDVTKYGDSTEMTTAYLSNNSFGSAPQVTNGSYAPQDNMQIVAWNNEIRS